MLLFSDLLLQMPLRCKANLPPSGAQWPSAVSDNSHGATYDSQEGPAALHLSIWGVTCHLRSALLTGCEEKCLQSAQALRQAELGFHPALEAGSKAQQPWEAPRGKALGAGELLTG